MLTTKQKENIESLAQIMLYWMIFTIYLIHISAWDYKITVIDYIIGLTGFITIIIITIDYFVKLFRGNKNE